MDIPPVLVLGCNTPHGIGVLSDWIEEQTGVTPDFTSTTWSDGYNQINGYGYGDGSGNGYGHGNGNGNGYGYGYGNGNGNGDGNGYGFGNGNGYGNGNAFGA